MATYQDLLDQMKTMSKEQLAAAVDKFTAIAMRGIYSTTTTDRNELCAITLTTLLSAVCADGYFNTDEYEVAKPALDAFLYEGVSYEETLDFIKEADIDSDETREMVDQLVDSFDAETKEALIIASAAICAADKDYKTPELNWLAKLLA